jgi:hypothetical protein
VRSKLILPLFLLLCGCSPEKNDTPDHKTAHTTEVKPTPKLKKYFSGSVLEILNAAESVETWRVHDSETRKPEELPARTAQGKTYQAERAQVFARLLLDEKNYDLEVHKTVQPSFGVLWVLSGKKGSVEVYQCFLCNEWFVRALDLKGKEVTHFTLSNDPVRKTLLQWAKEGLPDDKVIQGVE